MAYDAPARPWSQLSQVERDMALEAAFSDRDTPADIAADECRARMQSDAFDYRAEDTAAVWL